MKKEGFTSETLVQTPHGNKMIKDLNEGDLVLTLNQKTRTIEITPILEVEKFDDSDAIIETKLFTRKGEVQIIKSTRGVKMAKKHRNKDKELQWMNIYGWKMNSSILSNYLHINNAGYYMCSIHSDLNGNHEQKLHVICALYYLGDNLGNCDVHHKDGNKLNNKPDNLSYLPRKQHINEHPRNGEKSWFKKGEAHPGYGKARTDEVKKKIRKGNIINAVYRTDLSQKVIEIIGCLSDTKQYGYVPRYVSEACHGKHSKKYDGHFYRDSLWFFENEYKNIIEEREANHKYLGFDECSYEGKVYHLVVEDNHNFFVGGDDGILIADYTV